MGHIRDSGVSQNCLGERTGECTIVFIIVTEMLFLLPYWYNPEHVNYNNNNMPVYTQSVQVNLPKHFHG